MFLKNVLEEKESRGVSKKRLLAHYTRLYRVIFNLPAM